MLGGGASPPQIFSGSPDSLQAVSVDSGWLGHYCSQHEQGRG